MKNWKQISFLCFCLLLGCQLLAASANRQGMEPIATCQVKNTAAKHATLHAGIFCFDHLTPAHEVDLVKQPARHKKKFKRTYSSTTRLKQPVRDLNADSVNIFTEESYSQPFFLSQLHYFLFRLTPF